MGAAAGLLPTTYRNMNLNFVARNFLMGLDQPPARRHSAWLGSYPPAWQRELLSPDVLKRIDPEEAYEPADRHWRECPPNADEIHRVIYQYCKLYLQDDILTKIDRASMAHGLEARAPMLDPEFVEWVGTVPSDCKLRGWTKKYLFKKAVEGRVPRDIVQRRKKGFGMPIGVWLRGPLRSYMEDRLGARSLEALGLFQPSAVRRIIDAHLSGKHDFRKELWTLLTLVEWRRQFGGG